MDQYQKICDIGSGAYGEVYKALDVKTRQVVAIKRMKQEYSSWDACVQLREVQSLMALTKSPHVVKLFEVIQHTGTNELSFVFEFVSGGTLLNVITEARRLGTPLDEQLIKVYMYQTLQGVAYIHRSGYFHRDIKPENIFVSRDPTKNYTTIKVGDLGLAKEIRGRFPQTPYQGTRWYRAPELLLRDPGYTYKIDSFALGCVMFELFALQPLFPGSSELDMLAKISAFAGPPSSWPEGYRLTEKLGFKFPHRDSHGNSSIQGIQQGGDKEAFKLGLRDRLSAYAGLISENAVDLMAGLLVWNPVERLSAVQALKHPFFADIYRSFPGSQSKSAIVNSNTGQCLCPSCYHLDNQTTSYGCDNNGLNSQTDTISGSQSASRGSFSTVTCQGTVIDFDALETLLTGDGNRGSTTSATVSNSITQKQRGTPPVVPIAKVQQTQSVFDDILNGINNRESQSKSYSRDQSQVQSQTQSQSVFTEFSISEIESMESLFSSTPQNSKKQGSAKTLHNIGLQLTSASSATTNDNNINKDTDMLSYAKAGGKDGYNIDNDNDYNNNVSNNIKNEKVIGETENQYNIPYIYKDGIALTNSHSGFKNKNTGSRTTSVTSAKSSVARSVLGQSPQPGVSSLRVAIINGDNSIQGATTAQRPKTKTTKELLQQGNDDFNVEDIDFFDNI